MNIELRKKIEEIIKAYQANSELCRNEIQKIIDEYKDQVNKLKPEFIREAMQSGISEALEDSKKVNKVYNQKLKAVVEDVKKQVLPMYIKQDAKAADYATKVNNALQFIQIEAEQITDDTAYMILKDFIEDYDQMKLFKHVIGKRVELEDANGNTTFPKTFGKLNQVEVVLNTFNEIEQIANMLFLYQKEDGPTYVVNGSSYTFPIDSYDEIQDEDNILNLAAAVEEMANDVPGVDDVSDDTEHEPIVE